MDELNAVNDADYLEIHYAEILHESLGEQTIVANNSTIHAIVELEIYRLGEWANLNHIDVSNVTAMPFLFYKSRFNGDIRGWDVSKVRDMSGMFYGALFNRDISNWNTESVNNMSGMFHESRFNQDIGRWNVSRVKNMNGMFSGSQWKIGEPPFKTPFNQDISGWDVSGVDNMQFMFAHSMFRQDISNWNISNVRDMTNIFFESPLTLSMLKWDTSRVAFLEQAVKACDVLEPSPELDSAFEQHIAVIHALYPEKSSEEKGAMAYKSWKEGMNSPHSFDLSSLQIDSDWLG